MIVLSIYIYVYIPFEKWRAKELRIELPNLIVHELISKLAKTSMENRPNKDHLLEKHACPSFFVCLPQGRFDIHH